MRTSTSHASQRSNDQPRSRPHRQEQVGDSDAIVEKANGPYVLERLGSTDKRLLALDDSAHEITLDHGRERIMVEVWDFVRRLAGARAPAPSCDRLRARPAPRRVPTMPKLAAAIKAVPGLAPASGGCEHAVGH